MSSGCVGAADELGRARLVGRRQAAERRHVLVELLFRRLGDFSDRLVQRQVGIFLRRPLVDLVVDVRDVADIGDVLLAVEMAEQPEQHVEDDDRAGVADMGKVVDRRPADVHAHVRRIEGDKILLLAGQRVVEPQSHRPIRRNKPVPSAGTFRRIFEGDESNGAGQLWLAANNPDNANSA